MLAKCLKMVVICTVAAMLGGCYIVQPAPGTSVTIQNNS